MGLAPRWAFTHAFAVAASLAAVAVPCAAQTSEADVSAEARARYARGVALYDAGSYAEALVDLERASALAPSYKLLYSIGLVRLQLGDFAGSRRDLSAYLAAGGDGVAAARRAEVNRLLADLQTKVAIVEVRVSVDGAEVVLDDVSVGVSPLTEPLVVNPGRHRIATRLLGYRPDVLSLGVVAADRVSVALEPTREARGGDAVAPAPLALDPRMVETSGAPAEPAREPGRPLGAPALASWIATGALTVGVVVTGVVALSASSDLDTRRAGAPSSRAELDALGNRAHGFAVASDACLVGAIIAGGAALYFTFVAPARAPAPPRASGVGLGIGSVAWRGEF